MKILRKLTLLVLLSLSLNIKAQVAPKNPYFLGHSLINFNLPAMFQDLVKSSGIVGHKQAVTIMNGAALKAQWINPSSAQGPDYRTEFATKTHDVFVMTEAVPLKNHLKWSQTYEYATLFHNLAQANVAQCQTYIYETWHCTNSGKPEGCAYDDDAAESWRSRLTTYLPLWEGIADEVNKTTTGPDMLVIPAGQCIAMLHDEVIAGKFLPEYNKIEDFYSDDIHLNDIGHYFVALVMYATIYKSNPIGLTHQTHNEYGNPYKAPSVKHAKMMQEIVWKTVCAYPRSGVDCSGVSALVDTYTEANISIYPNPMNDQIMIQSDKTIDFIKVISPLGQVQIKTAINAMSTSVDVSNLSSGLFFLKSYQNGVENTVKIIKN